MATKAQRPRTVRRANDRSAEKLGDAREKLALLEPGGAASRPIDVPSASVVELQARSLGCARGCEGEARIVEHRAETIDGDRLRVVHTQCPRCGTKRRLYFRIAAPALN